MLSRRAFVVVAGMTLSGCGLLNRNQIVEERDPYEIERDGAAALEKKLADPATSEADIEATFESHALTLLSRSKNLKDKFNYQAIQTMAPGDPARTRRIELSLLSAMSRDYQNTATTRKLETRLKRGTPAQAQAARVATWQLASRTYWFY